MGLALREQVQDSHELNLKPMVDGCFFIGSLSFLTISFHAFLKFGGFHVLYIPNHQRKHSSRKRSNFSGLMVVGSTYLLAASQTGVNQFTPNKIKIIQKNLFCLKCF